MRFSRPNIIVMVADALRADHLSCYGYNKNTSPNIDKFAAECTVFDGAFSAAPATGASIPSILSGLYPSLHKTGVDGNMLTLNDEVNILPEMLAKHGYYTIGLNTNPLMAGKHGYNRGYCTHEDLFPDNKKIHTYLASRGPGGELRKEIVQYNRSYVCSTQVNQEIERWLKSNPKNPFFMWIHYMDTHSPYIPRSPFFEQYCTGRSGSQVLNFLKKLNQIFHALHTGTDRMSFEEKKMVVDCYDSEIRYFDVEFGRLMSLLKNYNLFDNTMMFFMADHGEEFWEHGHWGHFVRMYDINIRVPLLFKMPGSFASGKRITKQVRNIDILPTVLDVLQIDPKTNLSGLSLVPFIRDENSAPETPVISEGGGVKRISTGEKIDRLYSIRTPHYKYIKNTSQNTRELYKLEDDPFELSNIAHQAGVWEIINELEFKMNESLKPLTTSSKQINQARLDNLMLERLRALGYV